MRESSLSASSQRQLLSQNNGDGSITNHSFMRDPSALSGKEIQFQQFVQNNDQVEEQTLMQVQFENENLLRKAKRSELASKNTCLTRRWQTALVISLVLLALGVGIGK
jgi:hypothetical protein